MESFAKELISVSKLITSTLTTLPEIDKSILDLKNDILALHKKSCNLSITLQEERKEVEDYLEIVSQSSNLILLNKFL